ncbi:hypothetical protein FOVSG1_006548 [Fusarium oxysporum f. sp. vasinfectum]
MSLNIESEESAPNDAKRVNHDQEAPDMDISEEKAVSIPQRQDAFGEEESAEVKYKVLTWWQGGLLMVAETISLGILSLPKCVASLGLVPAIIILVGIGILASYTGYIIGQYKLRHPHITSMADAGETLFGPIGREVVGLTQLLLLVFIMASHILVFTTAMNTLTNHATCSMVFGIVGMVISCMLSLPRTLMNVSWLSLVSFASILISVLICMIALGVNNKASQISAVVNTGLVNGFTAAANIVLSYASHNSFFTFIAELRDPRDFNKALVLLQTLDMTLYVVTAVVIYYYAGPDVASPALGSDSPIISKVTYGVALPTILIAGVVNGHIAAKAVYLRVFAGTDRIHKRDFVAVGSWIAIGFGFWILAWIVASAIPVFNSLLSLLCSLFLSWFTFTLPGMFWLQMNWGLWFSTWRKASLTVLNFSIIAIGLVLCCLGAYTSGKAIHDDPGSGSFSCGMNK